MTYFILCNSLDAVLWELTRAKFEVLGEFVEGIRNLEMTVHKRKEGFVVNSDIDESDTDESDVAIDANAYAQVIGGDIENIGDEEVSRMKTRESIELAALKGDDDSDDDGGGKKKKQESKSKYNSNGNGNGNSNSNISNGNR